MRIRSGDTECDASPTGGLVISAYLLIEVFALIGVVPKIFGHAPSIDARKALSAVGHWARHSDQGVCVGPPS